MSHSESLDEGSFTPPLPGDSNNKENKFRRHAKKKKRKHSKRAVSNSPSPSCSDSPSEHRQKIRARKRHRRSQISSLEQLESQRDGCTNYKHLENYSRLRSACSPQRRNQSRTHGSHESECNVNLHEHSPGLSNTYNREQQPTYASTSNCRTSHRNEYNDIHLVKKLIDIMSEKCSSNSYVGAQNVIPLFDPSEKNQTAKDWLTKVNETATIYNWQEKQTIYYALPKLSGLAKRWYEGLSSVNMSWEEWQECILSTFPDDRNYGDKLYEMLERKSRRNETLEEYYYDKMSLLNICGIRDKNAVDCIIHGIYDNHIKLNAQGSNFQTPIELLRYLRSISHRTLTNFKKSYSNQIITSSNNKKNDSNDNRFKNLKCFNCSEIGHTAIRCLKPINKCGKCSRLGHSQENCRTTLRVPLINDKQETQRSFSVPLKSQQILTIATDSNDKNNKYFKTVAINGREHRAYIDFGSQCSLIKSSLAKEKGLPISRFNLPILRSFAAGGLEPLGRTSINIKVDSVNADIETYVVEDDLLSTDVLIGQTLTELPSVVVHKTSTSLYLYSDESSSQRLKLYSTLNLRALGTQLIPVYTETEYSGPIFVPNSNCMKDGDEYILMSGMYILENGKGNIMVISLFAEGTNFSKGKLVTRTHVIPFANSFNIMCNDKIEEINSIDTLDAITTKQKPSCEISLDMLNVGESITREEQIRLLDMLNKYRECFALAPAELGVTPIIEMQIKLSDNTPVAYKPYRLPYVERKIVRSMVDELLKNEIIRESNSPYASPIVLVKKKNGEHRLCVDYRALNKKTIKNKYPMPVIDDQLDRLSDKKFFTSLDLASGYHQIPVAEESRFLTAFITPDGHYEYTRMPFGLVNAPAVFQQMINKALGSKRFDLALPYLDDLLTAASDIEESLEKLESLLILLKKANLTLNIKKCYFLQTSIEYLGYEISKNGLRPGDKKTQAVSNFPTPTNVHQVRQFIGLASFFRRFVQDFATIARPLTSLTRNNVSWTWGSVQQTAFDSIKMKLISRPVLALYNPDHITEVHCDASKLGMGAILLQKPDEKSPLKPVAYYSRQTSKEEEFLHSYELETMAVVSALKKFRIYLIGLHFKVITDCSALRASLSKRDLIPRIARWWLQLQEFDFIVEYRPGLNMRHADALTRNPVFDSNDTCLEILNIRTEDWLHTVQMTDPKIKHIKDILETNVTDLKEYRNNYTLKNNRLFRRVGKNLKWVVPNGARWRICQIGHDESGHFAFEKTYDIISSEYWFPRMKRFVRKYVSACLNCAYNKKPPGKETGYLHPIPKVNEVFHTIHLDHLGPFVRSKRGNIYILGIIDGFSKFIFVKAVRNTKSCTTIKVLEDTFAIFGSPKVIITDQGTSFSSTEFKKFIQSIGAKHVMNAVATPRANGQIERYNRTILSSLASMNHDLDDADWDLRVPRLQWSLNNTLNKGIGKTPAEVVFGRRTTNSSEGIIKQVLDNNNGQGTENEEKDKRENNNAVSQKHSKIITDSETGAEKNIAEIQDKNENNRLQIRKTVAETININQKKMKESFNKKRAPTRFFKEGDLVMVPNYAFERGKSTKLAPKFRGPLKVTAVLKNDRYEVSTIDGHASRKYKNIFPGDHLKNWITFHSSPTESETEGDSD